MLNIFLALELLLKVKCLCKKCEESNEDNRKRLTKY